MDAHCYGKLEQHRLLHKHEVRRVVGSVRGGAAAWCGARGMGGVHAARRCGNATQGLRYRNLRLPCHAPTHWGKQCLNRIRKGLPPTFGTTWGDEELE